MKQSKRTYKKKVTRKYVEFYIKDEELLKVANDMNFQKFVKHCLQKIVDEEKAKKELEEKRNEIWKRFIGTQRTSKDNPSK